MELAMLEIAHRHDGCHGDQHLVAGGALVRLSDGSLVGVCVDCGARVVVRVVSAEALAA